MAGGGSQPTHTTTEVSNTTELPPEAKPLMNTMLNRSLSLSNQPYQAYEGDRIAGLTPEHYAGLDMTTQRAIQGSPAINAATDHAANVFNNTYMNQGQELAGRTNMYSGENPYLQGMIDTASQDVVKNYQNAVNPKLDAMDRASGSFGNTGVAQAREGAQEQLARQLGDISTGMRFNNYNQSAGLEQQRLNNQLALYGNERQQQANAMEFAPQLAQQDYLDAQNLLGVGDIYRQVDQQGLDMAYDDWLQYQQHPYKSLDVLASALSNTVGGNASSVQSAPSPYAANPTASMIGTGLAGYGLLQGFM